MLSNRKKEQKKIEEQPTLLINYVKRNISQMYIILGVMHKLATIDNDAWKEDLSMFNF